MTLCEKLPSVHLNVLMLTSFTCTWFSVTMSTTSEIISLAFVFLVLYIVFHSVAECIGFMLSAIIILEHCQLMNINIKFYAETEPVPNYFDLFPCIGGSLA